MGAYLEDLETLDGAALVAQVSGHLFALEDPARVLALTCCAVRAVGDRDTVGGRQTAKVPALHGALETLADRGCARVDILAGGEVCGVEPGARGQEGVGRDAELHQHTLGLDLVLGKVHAQRVRDLVGALVGRADLHGVVALLGRGLDLHDLHILQLGGKKGPCFE